MTRHEFDAKIQSINNRRDLFTALEVGHKIKEICREWLKVHKKLPKGYEGFAD